MEDKAIAPRGSLAPVTKKQAMYLLTTIWPEVPEAEIVKAALMCQQYNLNPLMKQIYIIGFNKKENGKVVGTTYSTVLGIGASRAIAQSKGFRYSYDDGPRVMTEQEQVDINGEVEVDKVWAITKIKDEYGDIFPGYGSWPKDTNVHGQDKGNTKRNMAFIRSERNALDRMAPGTLPADVELMDEEYSPVHDVPKAIAEGKKEFEEKVAEDIDDFWPGDDKVAEIDMIWLKESLEDIRDRKPLVYREISAWLKNAMEGRQFARWTEAVAALNREQAGSFVGLVQRALEL